MNHEYPHDERPPNFWRSRWSIGWLVLAAVGGWFLWAEHRAHVFGVLPYLILLACPLMHLFMHRGHHGAHRGGHHGNGAARPGDSAAPPSSSTGDRS